MKNILFCVALIALVGGIADAQLEPSIQGGLEEPNTIFAPVPQQALISPANNQPIPTPAPAGTRWEYKVIHNTGPMAEHQLNELGNNRWELATVIVQQDVFIYVMKRPKELTVRTP